MRRAVTAVLGALLVASCSREGVHRVSLQRGPVGGTTSTTAVPAQSVTTFPPPPPPPVPSTAAPAVAGCPAPAPRAQPWPERPRYTMHVDVRPADGVAQGDLQVHFTPDIDTDRLVFRLWPNGPRPAAAGAHLDAGPVSVDGAAAASRLDNPTTLVVPLAGGRKPGQAVDASLPWRLQLPGPVNDRVAHQGDSVRLGSFFPILPWEQGVGWDLEPPTAGFAEASTSPVADFAATVTVPAGYTVLASGADDGQGHWTANAVRDFAMSVGRFTVASGVVGAPNPVQVTVGVNADIPESPRAYLDKVMRVLQQHSARFGPYPWPTYTLAITPGLSGGIEYPSHVMQGSGTLGRTTSHELAHQWFYGLVGNDQGRDPWLDEGLATWGEARFEGTLSEVRSRPIPADARGHAGDSMAFWEPRQTIYFPGVYIQGAQALAALGQPDLVDCGLRLYVAANAYRIARPGDLIRSLATVFPNASGTMAPFGIRP